MKLKLDTKGQTKKEKNTFLNMFCRTISREAWRKFLSELCLILTFMFNEEYSGWQANGYYRKCKDREWIKTSNRKRLIFTEQISGSRLIYHFDKHIESKWRTHDITI